ncbi:MAG: hypothetical protein V3U88_11090, partial [Methylococcales bacterium]
GRKIAKNMGIQIIGFLGILLLNYRHDRLSKEEIEDILHHANNFNFRLSEKLKQDFFEKL